MKNKVFRLAVVAILVIAMVLSMAACGEKTPTTTTSPTTTTKPTTTTPSPTTPVPTTTTAPTTTEKVTDAELAAEMFGITVEDVTKTYDGYLAAADQDAAMKYLMINVDTDKSVNTKVAVTAKVDYKGTASTSNVDATVYNMTKDAEGNWVAGGYNADVLTTKALKVPYNAAAGVYEVELKITVTDNGFYFGKFGAIKNDTEEYTIDAVITVDKADAVVSVKDYVAPVQAATTPITYIKPTATDAAIAFVSIKSGDKTVATTEVDLSEAKLAYKAASLYDVSKVGSYEIVLSACDTADVTKSADFEDVTSDNYNLTFENGNQYFISGYDWNVIRDVATSIVEMDVDSADMVTLARSRYDALTDAQKVFFQTGITTGGASLAADAQYLIGEIASADIAATMPTGLSTGAEIYAYLVGVEKDLADEAIITAFEKAVTDAKYIDGDFTVTSPAHMTALGTVDAYWTAMSEADQKVVKTGDGTQYNDYMDAKALVGASEVDKTVELIAAAINAYNRAIDNGTKPVYSATVSGATTVVKFINNAEVKSTANVAKAAYDALTDAQKKVVADATKYVMTNETMTNFNNGVVNYKLALDAILNMNSAVAYMSQVIDYAKVNDYFHLDNTTPSAVTSEIYTSLDLIVYGTGVTAGEYGTSAGSKGYFTGDATVTGEREGFYAMSDIINAITFDKAHIDAVIAEYKGIVDYVVAAEAAKTATVTALKDAAKAEFVAENDYKQYEIELALANDNKVMVELTKNVMNEITTEIKATVGGSDKTVVGDNKLVVDTVQNVLNSAKSKDLESANKLLVKNFLTKDAIDGFVDTYNASAIA